MRKLILPILLLPITFCVMPVFSQTYKTDLTLKVIKLNKIKIPNDKCYGDACEFDEKTKRFLFLFVPLLSKKGSLEVDSRGNALVISDTVNRIEVIENFAKILDKSGLDFDDLFLRKSDESILYPLKIQLQNLTFSINCGTGQEKANWQEKQSEILLGIIKLFASEKATIEVASREKTLIITDEQNRGILIKQITELFDKQFLEEFN